MYSRLRFDISTRDFLFGILACVWAHDRRKLTAEAVKVCSSEGNELVCFSVRSGFDLLLQALALPTGSEVLVSAVNHPDMVSIIEQHGLRVIPVDLDLETLAPRKELLERAVSPRTRAILVAHLFGGRVDLGPIADFTREHNLLLFEDCAQAFHGPHDTGDPLADVSMYSFGSLKTATSLGGAIFYVRNPEVLGRMRKLQASWPVQRRRDYFGKLLKFLFLAQITRTAAYGLFVRVCELLGKDLDALVGSLVRAFPSPGCPAVDEDGNAGATRQPDEKLFERLHVQPSAPLLALLAHRLRSFDAARLARRAWIGEQAARRLPPSVMHPGRFSVARTHWLFPVVAHDPEILVAVLRCRGFDASRAASNISVVETFPDGHELFPAEASRMIWDIVFLPIYPELPAKALWRLIEAVEVADEGACGGSGRAEVRIS